MCIDKTGKLWFATDKGILRFDGNDLVLFNHNDEDSTTLRVNSCGRLYLDDSDNLYIVSIPGMGYLNTKTGKYTAFNISFRDEDKSKIAFPYAFSEPFTDDDASIWMGMYNVGFVHYFIKTNKTIYYPLHEDPASQNNSVYSIKRDLNNKNILWLATDDGIYSFNKSTQRLSRKFINSKLQGFPAQELHITNMDIVNDTIWFAAQNTGMGYYSIKRGTYTLYPYTAKNGKNIAMNISFLQRKNNYEYYIAEDDKLPGTFNTKTFIYQFISSTSDQLPAIQLRHFVADSSDNVWSLIFYQLYFAKNNKHQFKTFKLPDDESTHKLENAFKLAVWNKTDRNYYIAFDTRDEIFVLDSNLKLIRKIPIESGNGSANKNEFVMPQIGTGTIQHNVKIKEEEPNIFDMGFDNLGRLWLCGSSLWMYNKALKKITPVKVYPQINFSNLRFQNIQFFNDYLYLQPSTISSNAFYRINLKNLTCDSIRLPAEILADSSGEDQAGKKTDIIQIDKEQKFAYFCYNRTVFQFNLLTKKAKKIITFSQEEKPFQHFFNMCWYLPGEDGNLWVASLSGLKVFEPHNLQLIKSIPFDKDVYPIQLCSIEGKNIICVLNSDGLLLIDEKNDKHYKLGLNDGLVTVFNSGVSCVNNMIFVGAIDYMQYLPLPIVLNHQTERSCYLSAIKVFNKYIKTDSLPGFLQTLRLNHDQNFITLSFSSTSLYQPERRQYRYKMDGVDKDWVYSNYLNRTISYTDLNYGSYVFHAEVKNDDGTWSSKNVNLSIYIIPAWWQTDLVKILLLFFVITGIFLFGQWRINSVRKQEQLKTKFEKEMLGMEAKALRAQMNPHFIFNCMNSIKSLIQKNEQEKAVNYLTTFSKLIRTIFQNSDKREISLHEEIETCRLYVQLEKMRSAGKISYAFNIDETIDLKSVMVPALIIQPFIENAIWHGIMPKEEEGKLIVSVAEFNNSICCTIDDNGIGREISKQNKSSTVDASHESRGEHLTQARLDLDNLLNDHNTTIEIIDKKDEGGNAAGTTIKICFKEY